MKDEPKNIVIPIELYESLRKYCDHNGFRFLEFIADALESATYRDQLERLFNDEAALKERIESERIKGIQQGFSQGVLAATLILNGSLRPCEAITPKEAKDVISFQPVEGGQKKMFD